MNDEEDHYKLLCIE